MMLARCKILIISLMMIVFASMQVVNVKATPVGPYLFEVPPYHDKWTLSSGGGTAIASGNITSGVLHIWTLADIIGETAATATVKMWVDVIAETEIDIVIYYSYWVKGFLKAEGMAVAAASLEIYVEDSDENPIRTIPLFDEYLEFNDVLSIDYSDARYDDPLHLNVGEYRVGVCLSGYSVVNGVGIGLCDFLVEEGDGAQVSMTVYRANYPPETPSAPWGPTFVYRNEWNDYYAVTTDPDEDLIRYQFELSWSTETQTGTTGWYQSGETGELDLFLGPGTPPETCQLRVRAQDFYGLWSDWSPPLTINVTIPVNLTVLAEDQYGNSLTTGDVYIDEGETWCGLAWRGLTGSTFPVAPGTHTVFVNDFWESGNTGNRCCWYAYGNHGHWEDGSTNNPRTITVVEDTTIKAYFYKKLCPGDCNGDGYVNAWDLSLLGDAWLTERGELDWNSCGDCTGDGHVNVWDLSILSANWLEEYEDE